MHGRRAGLRTRAGTDEMSHMSETDGPQVVRRRRKIRWVVIGVLVLALLGAGTAVLMTRISGNKAEAAPQSPANAQTVEVVRMDLADRRTLTGKLGYGTERTLTGRKPGTITQLPAQGAVLDRGKTVYQVDAKPVPLFYSDIPLYRDLAMGMTDGPDVQAVEENLRALGFSGFGTPDKKFTDATTNAIKKWQKSLGLDETGVLPATDVIVTTGPLRVSSVVAELGSLGTNQLVKYTSTQRAVTLDVRPAQKDMAKPGSKVSLAVAGKPVDGTVAGVAPAAADANQGDARFGPGGPPGSQEPKFTVTITIDDPAAVGEQDAGSVEVRFTSDTRKGALVVPVGALLALAEGGYALEVVEGAGTRLIGVKTGLFADGKVEVTGDEVREGLRVVTTS
jgi:peptidoglycan hydrolase-like protein with peptidoglycan-binding domain